jgi:hypothetical protein
MLKAIALLFLKILEQWLTDSRVQEAPMEEVKTDLSLQRGKEEC